METIDINALTRRYYVREEYDITDLASDGLKCWARRCWYTASTWLLLQIL